MAAHADDTKLARFYCGRRVLVTGHTGLLGRWMVALLSACGAEAVGFARGVADEPGAGVIAFAGDIRNPDAVRKAVAASGRLGCAASICTIPHSARPASLDA